MADKAIGELPRAPAVQDDSLLPLEQQGEAMHMTGRQFADFARASVRSYVDEAAQSAADAEKTLQDTIAAGDTIIEQAQQIKRETTEAGGTIIEQAQAHADRAEAARDSIVLDEEKLAQLVADAAKSAQSAEQSRRDTAAEGERIIADAAEQAEAAALSAAEAEQTVLEAGEAARAEAEGYAVLSRSWAEGGTGTRTDEDVSNSKYWAARAQSYAEQASVPAVQGVYNVILEDRATGEKYALIVEDGRPCLLGVADTFDATQMVFIDSATGAGVQLVVENARLFTEEV